MPFAIVTQLFVAGGTVVGLGFLFPEIDVLTATFLATGAATLSLVVLGMVMLPQVVAEGKQKGTFEYLWTLPVPRLSFLAADLTMWVTITLPGMIVALVIASLRYDVDFSISPLVIPAFLLVALTAALLGNAVAHLSPSPVLTGVITTVIIYALFMFAPVNFPADRLPGGLQALHDVLPVQYMADLVRGTLTDGIVDDLALAFGVVGAWTVGTGLANYAIFTRRN